MSQHKVKIRTGSEVTIWDDTPHVHVTQVVYLASCSCGEHGGIEYDKAAAIGWRTFHVAAETLCQ